MAMQALFSMDMGSAFSEIKLHEYRCSFPPGKRLEVFFDRLSAGVIENKEMIDTVIENYSSNWKISRMACVDRNVLRLAVYEILFCADIPAKVTINEAIDIGKKFGTSESGSFINGILDSIRNAIEKGDLQPVVPKEPALYQHELPT